MNLFGKNKNTNILGIGSLLSSLGVLLKCFQGDAGIDWHCVSLALPGVLSGIGLIFAKDRNVTHSVNTGEAKKTD